MKHTGLKPYYIYDPVTYNCKIIFHIQYYCPFAFLISRHHIYHICDITFGKMLISVIYIYCLLLTTKLHFHLWWTVFSPSSVHGAFCCLICVVCMARVQLHFVSWCCCTGVNAATLTQVLSLLLPSCLHLVSQETSLLQVPLLYHYAFFIFTITPHSFKAH